MVLARVRGPLSARRLPPRVSKVSVPEPNAVSDPTPTAADWIALNVTPPENVLFPENAQLPLLMFRPPAPLIVPESNMVPAFGWAAVSSMRVCPRMMLPETVMMFGPANSVCGVDGVLPAWTVTFRPNEETVVPRLSVARVVPVVSPSRIGDVPVPSAESLLTARVPPRTWTPPVKLGLLPARVIVLVFRLMRFPVPEKAPPKATLGAA